MVEMTVQLPEELAERCGSVGPWLGTIIELGLAGFTTQAVAAASEVGAFLSGNPSPEAVMGFHVSEAAQSRLQRLLALNESGLLSEAERRELDELRRLEHIVAMLKLRAAQMEESGDP